MRRWLVLLGYAVTLAACTAADAPPPGATAELVVGFPAGGLTDTITVTAVDRQPLRSAELIAPDGTTTPANWMDANSRLAVRTGQAVANDPWQASLTGTTAAAALTTPNVQPNAALRSEVRLLAIVSQGLIPLPDPVAYRRDWANYRIRLTFGTPPGELEVRDIAAPQPPPLPAAPPLLPIPPSG